MPVLCFSPLAFYLTLAIFYHGPLITEWRDQVMAILLHHLLQSSIGPIRAKQITQCSSVIGWQFWGLTVARLMYTVQCTIFIYLYKLNHFCGSNIGIPGSGFQHFVDFDSFGGGYRPRANLKGQRPRRKIHTFVRALGILKVWVTKIVHSNLQHCLSGTW